MELVDGGSVINGAYPVLFLYHINIIVSLLVGDKGYTVRGFFLLYIPSRVLIQTLYNFNNK